MRRSRVLVTVLLLVTFAAGVAGGVAADRLWLRPSGGRSAPGAAADREDKGGKHDGEDTVIERFSEELGLTADQEARIDTVLKHYRHRMKELRKVVRPRYDALVDSARRRIEAVLDSAQVRKYRKLLDRKRDRNDGRSEDGRR